MHTRSEEYIKSNNLSPDIFIENFDYANSELLYKIDKVTDYAEYVITKNEHRIDLIAIEIYGNEKYSWLLMYINRLSIDQLTRRTVLKYIPISELTEIINSI